MKQIRLVPLYRTFTNWVITVIIGSILLPFVSALFGNNSVFVVNDLFDDDTLGLILLCMIASALCSLPALIILFFTHLILNRTVNKMRNHQLVQNAVHLVVSVITFAVLAIHVRVSDYDFLFAVMITYLSVGVIVWNVTYLLYRRKKKLVVEKSDLLD